MGVLKQTNTSKRITILLALVLAVILATGSILYVLLQMGHGKEEKAQVITVSTLERIIKVSELSTFTAVYNGIAEVKN